MEVLRGEKEVEVEEEEEHDDDDEEEEEEGREGGTRFMGQTDRQT